jgi:predicted nucleic acid-binding protein
MPNNPKLITVFFDSDALIAGSASREGAAFILLQLAELGMIKGFTSQQVVDECRKNLFAKLPDALPAFEKILTSAITILENPSGKETANFEKMAHIKDAPILTAALKMSAHFLVTFNTKHFNPDPELKLRVLRPGDLLKEIRARFSRLADE